ncbi:MAG: hypothetical protein AAGI22_00885 [Planctomycetota bacterium]
MLALASLAALVPLVPAQSGDLAELLVREDGDVPGLPSSSRIFELESPVAGRGGGWIVGARANEGTGGPTTGMLLGQLPGTIGGPALLLRRPGIVQGISQGPLTGPSMANGTVAYLEKEFNSPTATRAWVEDQLVAESGQPVPGSPGWTWTGFRQIEMTVSGEALVVGRADDGGPLGRSLVWRWPAGQIELASGQSLAGLGQPIAFLSGRITTSPDGSRWTIGFREEVTNRAAYAVDGQLFDFGGGSLSIEGEPVPPSVAATTGPANWLSFLSFIALNEAGDYAIEASLNTASGIRFVQVRNGRLIEGGPLVTRIVGIDARGGLEGVNIDGTAVIDHEDHPVLRPGFGVDDDGDGAADPGYQVFDIMSTTDVVVPDTENLVLFRGRFRFQGAAVRSGIFRCRSLRIDRPTCAGVVNSTGSAGQLVVVGGGLLADNEASLRLFGLPSASAGYVLVSRTAGFVPQPGGSQGDLCLGGSIGRMIQQVFLTGFEGRADVSLDLNAIPQPTGSVAAIAGETWFAQSWYRDSVQGTGTSNFTSASGLTFD